MGKSEIEEHRKVIAKLQLSDGQLILESTKYLDWALAYLMEVKSDQEGMAFAWVLHDFVTVANDLISKKQNIDA